MELYQKYDVYVISDEIWADLTMPGYRHIPTQMISDDARTRTIALYAPSKTFNLAGLVGSYHVIYNPLLRDRITKAGAATHYNSMNVLSMHASDCRLQQGGTGVAGRASPGPEETIWSMRFLLSMTTLRESGRPCLRVPTCCFWTAQTGAGNTIQRLTSCRKQASKWA